ncbi:YbgA family protein [Salinicoccus sesuvii]|uniref:YbgA family protein n=1 Tax=Salinicoccus sesuvii TaxID=868281 RepID=A0ABV7N9F2_9STAP
MSTRVHIEKLWAKEKYKVMYHSQSHYNHLRNVLKSEPTYETVRTLIESAQSVPPTQGSRINTFDHVWGYFKNICDTAEKEEYKVLKQAILSDIKEDTVMIGFLKHLSEKYQVSYLLNSSLIQSEK